MIRKRVAKVLSGLILIVIGLAIFGVAVTVLGCMLLADKSVKEILEFFIDPLWF